MPKKEELKATLIYNKENLHRFNLAGYNSFRWVVLILVSLYTILQILDLIFNKTIPTSIPIVCILLIGLEAFYEFYISNLLYKRTLINNNNEDVELELSFKDDAFMSQKKGDKGEYKYGYDTVKKIIETKDMIVIVLKYKLGFPIMKNNTSEETIDKIKRYVLEKNPHVKVRKSYIYKSWILLILAIINAILLGIAIAL